VEERELDMPTVGKKKFPYTAKGKAAAKKAAAKSTKNKKLAAMAAPKNKVTRRDVITAARRKAKKGY